MCYEWESIFWSPLGSSLMYVHFEHEDAFPTLT